MKQQHHKTIAISVGEPAGIGPDIVIQLAEREWPCQIVAFASKDLMRTRADALRTPLQLLDWNASTAPTHQPGSLVICDIPLGAPVTPGQLDPNNSDYVIRALNAATQACLDHKTAALVTAPIHKGNLNAAGFTFTGHTEHLAILCRVKKTVMLFATTSQKIALQTTHLPLRAVPDAITANALQETLTILHDALTQTYHINHPHIAVCGLNPHAGENGYLGREEIDLIAPLIGQYVSKGWHLTGPHPADTAFLRRSDYQPDAVLAMYHDQALPVIKTQYFDEAVNVTLGLPIIRTSVDHGTALSLAGTGHARAENICHALRMAIKLAT